MLADFGGVIAKLVHMVKIACGLPVSRADA